MTDMTDLQLEVQALREGTSELSEQIGKLSGALVALNALQQRQLETEVKVAEVERNTVTKEMAAREKEFLRKQRRMWLIRTGIVGIAATVVILAAIGFGFYLVNQLHDQQRSTVEDQQKGCQRTQIRVQADIDKELELAGISSAAEAKIHREAAGKFQASLVDCVKTYPLP